MGSPQGALRPWQQASCPLNELQGTLPPLAHYRHPSREMTRRRGCRSPSGADTRDESGPGGWAGARSRRPA